MNINPEFEWSPLERGLIDLIQENHPELPIDVIEQIVRDGYYRFTGTKF